MIPFRSGWKRSFKGIKQIIQANPATRKDNFQVALYDFSAAGLDIMLYFFLEVSDWGKELVERQRIFLEIIRLADALGVEFAPTQQIEAFRGRNSLKQAAESNYYAGVHC